MLQLVIGKEADQIFAGSGPGIGNRRRAIHKPFEVGLQAIRHTCDVDPRLNVGTEHEAAGKSRSYVKSLEDSGVLAPVPIELPSSELSYTSFKK